MSDNILFRVGSRKSQLAMIQTNLIVKQLQELHPHLTFEIVGISTTGDKILDVALSKIGEKSLFTKELEVALLNSEVDFVVHSLKDLPTILPEGLTIGAIPKREDPRDAIVLGENKDVGTKNPKALEDFAPGSVIGTSSPRRIAQLRNKYPNLSFMDIRGNLNTRLKKLDDPNLPYSAILLATAGLNRMGWYDRISFYLDTESWKYAVGQGALAVECLSSNTTVLKLLEPLNHSETYLSCIAERSFLKTLEGGCSVPVGVSSTLTKDTPRMLLVSGVVYNLEGSKEVNVTGTTNLSEVSLETKEINSDTTSIFKREFLGYHSTACLAAAKLGVTLANEAFSHGARDILIDRQNLNNF